MQQWVLIWLSNRLPLYCFYWPFVIIGHIYVMYLTSSIAASDSTMTNAKEFAEYSVWSLLSKIKKIPKLTEPSQLLARKCRTVYYLTLDHCFLIQKQLENSPVSSCSLLIDLFFTASCFWAPWDGKEPYKSCYYYYYYYYFNNTIECAKWRLI